MINSISNLTAGVPQTESKCDSASKALVLFYDNMNIEDGSKGKHSGLSEDEIVEVYDALDTIIETGKDEEKELAGNLKDYMDDLIETYGKKGDSDTVVSYTNYLALNGDGIFADLQYEKGDIQQNKLEKKYGHKVETAGQLLNMFNSNMTLHEPSEGKQSGLTQEEIDDFYFAYDTIIETGKDEEKELAGNLKDYMDDLIETYGKKGDSDIVVSYDDYLTLNGDGVFAGLQYEKGDIQQNKKLNESEKPDHTTFMDKIKEWFNLK